MSMSVKPQNKDSFMHCMWYKFTSFSTWLKAEISFWKKNPKKLRISEDFAQLCLVMARNLHGPILENRQKCCWERSQTQLIMIQIQSINNKREKKYWIKLSLTCFFFDRGWRLLWIDQSCEKTVGRHPPVSTQCFSSKSWYFCFVCVCVGGLYLFASWKKKSAVLFTILTVQLCKIKKNRYGRLWSSSHSSHYL